MFILAGTRPVYVAFSMDRLEVVSARDISEAELAAAREPAYASLPFNGPRLVGIEVPQAEHNEVLFEELNGNEVHMRPRFYVPYDSQLTQIRARLKQMAALEQKFPASKSQLDAAVARLGIPATRVGWLPVHHRNGFWTALMDTEDGKPLAYLDLDPY